jgi:8-amino-7-oxononanoate synthase
MVIDGNRVVSFCSNDYLGLANHPKMISAFKRAANEYGIGSGAAHLINGHSRAHHALEEELADFTGRQRALLFSTGYMANLGITTALLKQGDWAFEDRLNHASLLDAGRLCGARMVRYLHRNPEDLGNKLTKRISGEKLILTDGVFSMDGDIAPLPRLVKQAQRHDAWLMVDDAHGVGVMGDTGHGTLEHYGITQTQVPILMGTLGKAFGTFGAFVAGSEELIEALIQAARTYIYTTASPPAIAEATRTSLQIVENEPWRREHLSRLIRRFQKNADQLTLPLQYSPTAIQPIVIGDPEEAVRISTELVNHGFLATAIRPPTVPPNTARLRVTFSASHTEQQVDRLCDTLAGLIV